ncbi:MAG TPA: FAA hydrolase family protein, partial [Chloroflexota bacterium]|nr:FAA hydrolase family protein [Chloroflexota bacterium]
MKLVTYQAGKGGGEEPRVGVLSGDRVIDVAPDMVALLTAGERGLREAEAAAGRGDRVLALADVRRRAPILRPGKVLARAGNYRAHRNEGGSG